ncbi:MAG: hypothetical protein ACM3ZC_13295 [Bacteroidota bacterium]
MQRFVINLDELRALTRAARVSTRAELARGFGIDQAAATRMLQGKYRSVNAQTAERMRSFFQNRGLDPTALFKGDAQNEQAASAERAS